MGIYTVWYSGFHISISVQVIISIQKNPTVLQIILLFTMNNVALLPISANRPRKAKWL